MIAFGIDRILKESPEWKNQRIGLVTNHAAFTNKGVPGRKAMLDAGFKLVTLFSPEHGLDMKGADGAFIPDATDPLTGLPIISLYGEKLKPSHADLAHIDLLIFDIPDIGSRFYTYLWTLTYLLEACADEQKLLIVLDRPNPVSGNFTLAEGPIMEESTASFIGRWPIPVRHSCSLGELALYFNRERQIGCKLDVIRCENWKRNDFLTEWGTGFQSTSPAIQSFESMLLYPGLCLLEATNLSEGRGTDKSFCMVGAPWIDGFSLANRFNQLGLDEILARAVRITPESGKYTYQPIEGIEFQILEKDQIRSVTMGFLLIYLIKSSYPEHFKWAPYPTRVNPGGTGHLDKLTGISDSEKLFDIPFHQFLATITKLVTVKSWKQNMEPYLLY